MTRSKVLNYICENRMIEEGQAVVLGVSGGADSMCLLDIMSDVAKKLKLRMQVVHIHHGIRGETADRDAEFVEKYCATKDIACLVKNYDVPSLAAQWGMSHEEAGRQVRYDAFQEVLSQLGGEGKIAVAHNADDKAETVLFNLLRGSGIKGIAGIKPVRENVIRPILCLSRDEIENYNSEHNIEYVQDETNLTDEYTRNKIRLNILPGLKDINSRAVEHINGVAESLALIDDYMESQGQQIYGRIVVEEQSGCKLYVKTTDFEDLHIAMKAQLMKMCLYTVAGKAKDITKQHIDSVCQLFDMPVGKTVNLPYCMVAEKEYQGVSIKRGEEVLDKDKHSPYIENVVHIFGEGVYPLEMSAKEMNVTVEKDVFTTKIFEENQYTKWIDCDILKCDLQIRTRRNGDYIVVDDKGSRKKLKDFFIDRKIPKKDREDILLVANGSDIVWVIGYRLSAAYKVTETSENIWKMQIC